MARCIDCYRCVRICDELQGQGVWHIRDRGLGTRIEPDGSSLRDSSCVGCGACVDTCPTGAGGGGNPALDVHTGRRMNRVGYVLGGRPGRGALRLELVRLRSGIIMVSAWSVWSTVIPSSGRLLISG